MTLKRKNDYKRQSERGNVLFLILIAVALFAALSYAVTSSTRTGPGDASDETNLISTAEITQYPNSLKTQIIRMSVSKNVDVTTLNFDPPSDFATTCNATPGPCVFHPLGGGAIRANAPADVMLSGTPGTWYYSGHYEVTNIGLSTATDPAGNDIIAFLPGIKSAICTRINTELGISGDTTHSADLDVTAAAQQMVNGYSIPSSEINIGTAGSTAALDGQPFGCITDSAGEYIYYHVLVER